MRSRFDSKLDLLNDQLIEMGSLCEEAIAASSKSMSENSRKDAEHVSACENEINKKEREIETLCLGLLLKEQPVAGDLRLISSALKMITDMERIGDQAEDIAEISLCIDKKPGDEYKLINSMTLTSVGMVTGSIDAFVKRDYKTAEAVILKDDEVDNDFVTVKKMLIDMVSDNCDDGEYILDLLMVSKYTERIADHAVNIAKWVRYAITGERNADF